MKNDTYKCPVLPGSRLFFEEVNPTLNTDGQTDAPRKVTISLIEGSMSVAEMCFISTSLVRRQATGAQFTPLRSSVSSRGTS